MAGEGGFGTWLPQGWELPPTLAAFPGQFPGSTGAVQSTPRWSGGGSNQQRGGGRGGDSKDRDHRGSGERTIFTTGGGNGGDNMEWLKRCMGQQRSNPIPELPNRGNSSREIISDDESPMITRQMRHVAREMAKSWHCRASLLLVAAFASIGAGFMLVMSGGGESGYRMPTCSDVVPCPDEWSTNGGPGGFFCENNGGCRPGASGPWPNCLEQCYIAAPGGPPAPLLRPFTGPAHLSPAPAPEKGGSKGGGGGAAPTPAGPTSLTKAGEYDLRVVKDGKLLGCAAPVGKFPGQPKYGCAGDFATAQTCDDAKHPVKDTKYVAAVHAGCETALGRGTYGYAYDDGVGLKQCAPVTRYEWILCPQGAEGSILWPAEPGISDESTKRFRVTNKCNEPIWIQQAGAAEEVLPKEEAIRRIEPGAHYTYSIPNKGLPSTRFLPKTGCDEEGNNCDIQSMPPCPATGCDLPIDTKFEASWGCQYATGNPEHNKERCSKTGQGNPSTYQDWWDGSAVDGWTLPFTVLVDDQGHGLAPGIMGSPEICGPVVCANLVAENLCPQHEFLTPDH